MEDVFHAFIFYLLNLATSTREDNSNKGVCVVWLYTYADQAGMYFVCLWVCYISYRRGLTGVAYPRVGQCESLRGGISKNQIPPSFRIKPYKIHLNIIYTSYPGESMAQTLHYKSCTSANSSDNKWKCRARPPPGLPANWRTAARTSIRFTTRNPLTQICCCASHACYGMISSRFIPGKWREV